MSLTPAHLETLASFGYTPLQLAAADIVGSRPALVQVARRARSAARRLRDAATTAAHRR